MADGVLRIQDGPFADTKEQLGGTLRDRRAEPRRGDLLGSRRRRRCSGARWRSDQGPRTPATACGCPTDDGPCAERAPDAAARAAAERAARASYGRLVALLAAADGDIAHAEDALGDAFAQALAGWAQQGVPDNPEGWLLTVARNRQRDSWKSAATRKRAVWDAAAEHAAGSITPLDDLQPDAIGDRRLELLFVCAHPAIDASVRTPLMLQTVLGFDATQIGRVFAVAPGDDGATARPREAAHPRCPDPLRRARARSGASGSPRCSRRSTDASPPAGTMPTARRTAPRVDGGRSAVPVGHTRPLLEDDPEAWSLAALIALSLSRAAARAGPFIPLEEQDTRAWDRRPDRRGRALPPPGGERSPGPPGRLQLEAAMQAVHAARAHTGATDWAALETLSSALVNRRADTRRAGRARRDRRADARPARPGSPNSPASSSPHPSSSPTSPPGPICWRARATPVRPPPTPRPPPPRRPRRRLSSDAGRPANHLTVISRCDDMNHAPTGSPRRSGEATSRRASRRG